MATKTAILRRRKRRIFWRQYRKRLLRQMHRNYLKRGVKPLTQVNTVKQKIFWNKFFRLMRKISMPCILWVACTIRQERRKKHKVIIKKSLTPIRTAAALRKRRAGWISWVSKRIDGIKNRKERMKKTMDGRQKSSSIVFYFPNFYERRMKSRWKHFH